MTSCKLPNIEKRRKKMFNLNARVAVSTLLVADDDAGEKYLLLHNTKRKKWELPGGKLEPGEDIPTAAAREVLEETQRKIAPPKRVAGFYSNPTGDDQTFVFALMFTTIPSGEFEPVLSIEHDDWKWVSIIELMDMDSKDLAPRLYSWVHKGSNFQVSQHWNPTEDENYSGEAEVTGFLVEETK
jgi:8-oxo-dGTP pyrophosphatase MutT (NUDIX family)